MALFYQDEIDKVEKCPLSNVDEDIVLYRLIKSEAISQKDIEPKSSNPNFKATEHVCESWGLSTYDNLKSAVGNFQLMPKKLRERFSHVAKVNATKDFGVKYQTFDDESHYTLFPSKDDKILDKFTVVDKLP